MRMGMSKPARVRAGMADGAHSHEPPSPLWVCAEPWACIIIIDAASQPFPFLWVLFPLTLLSVLSALSVPFPDDGLLGFLLAAAFLPLCLFPSTAFLPPAAFRSVYSGPGSNPSGIGFL